MLGNEFYKDIITLNGEEIPRGECQSQELTSESDITSKATHQQDR